MVVLVLVAAAIAVTGVAAKQPVFGGTGSENSVPFSLVPITGGPITSTTGSSTSASSTTSTSTTATSTTSTTGPEAVGGLVGNLVYALW